MSKERPRRGEMTDADRDAALRLKAIWTAKRTELGLTQESAGGTLGFNQSAVSQYLNGKIPIGTDAALKWAALLEVGPGEIRPELQNLTVASQPKAEPPPPGDNFTELSIKSLAIRKLPLIDWVQAGTWSEVTDPHQPGDAEDWINIIAKVSEKSFLLRVRGDSMTSPHGPHSAPEGSMIVVDPEAQAENGSLVIAKLDDSNEATFKKLIIDAGQHYLKPLNPDYKTIHVNGNCRIIGVVKQILIQL